MWSGTGQSAEAQPQQNPSSGESDAANIAADVFGHMAYLDGLASKININAALAEMQTELAAIPATEKVALVQAQRLKPQLLNDEQILSFLWAENFSAPVSDTSVSCDVFLSVVSLTRYQQCHHLQTLTLTETTGRCQEACPVLE